MFTKARAEISSRAFASMSYPTIFFGVGEHHGYAALQVLNVAAVIPNCKTPARLYARRIPVPAYRNGFSGKVDRAVTRAADTESPPQGLRGGVRKIVRV